MAKTLNDLVAFLNGLRGQAPLPRLIAELEEVDVRPDEIAPFISYSTQTYRRNLMREGPWYNLLILCWRNGQRSPIHDHRGSCCALRVVEGVMTETQFEFAPNHHVKPTFSRDLQPGQVIGSEDTDMHQVSNLQADDANLVTMHIYSPPLLVMGTYSLFDRIRGEEPMLLEFCDAAGI